MGHLPNNEPEHVPRDAGSTVTEVASAPRLRTALKGTRGLAVNGGALMINVFVSGIGGFAFWIIAARSADPAVVARASAMVTSILGVTTLSQQSLVVNLPILIAGSPRPRRVAGHAYLAALAITVVTSSIYLAIGTRVASGLTYLSNARLAAVFILGSVMWSIFSLQDAVLTGLRRGRTVLAENTIWAGLRLVLLIALPVVGMELGVGWIVGTWLIPATLLVAVITWYLFVMSRSPLRRPRGDVRLHRRSLFAFLGVEHLGALTNGLVQIVTPAVALTALGAEAAAPFLAAYSLLVVTEVAMGTFSGAFAVEVRRKGTASRNMIGFTCVLLGTICLLAIVGAQFFGDDFMGLFGPQYREPGGAVLAILVFGLPATSLRSLSSAANRLRQAGWRNFAQHGTYAVVLFLCYAIGDIHTAPSLAVCLVIARYASAAVSLQNLRDLRANRGFSSNRTTSPWPPPWRPPSAV
jgi:hypothetical protein